MANSVDPDQTAPEEQSDHGLQFLLKHSLNKFEGHCGMYFLKTLLRDCHNYSNISLTG